MKITITILEVLIVICVLGIILSTVFEIAWVTVSSVLLGVAALVTWEILRIKRDDRNYKG